MAANGISDPDPDAQSACAFCEVAQQDLVVEQLVGVLVLGRVPTELLIPDGGGNRPLPVIHSPHGIESAQSGSVDEHTIQTKRRRCQEVDPDGHI